MSLIEWEVEEDSYQEQIYIPQKQTDQAAAEGIVIENKAQVTIRITNMTTGEEYLSRLKITGNRQLYLPTEVQKLLQGSKTIRLRIFGN